MTHNTWNCLFLVKMYDPVVSIIANDHLFYTYGPFEYPLLGSACSNVISLFLKKWYHVSFFLLTWRNPFYVQVQVLCSIFALHTSYHRTSIHLLLCVFIIHILMESFDNQASLILIYSNYFFLFVLFKKFFCSFFFDF